MLKMSGSYSGPEVHNGKSESMALNDETKGQIERQKHCNLLNTTTNHVTQRQIEKQMTVF